MDIKEQIYQRVLKFMIDEQVSCEEAIYQCDNVIENAYEFIAELYKIIEDELPVIDEEN